MPKTKPFDHNLQQYESWFEKHKDLYDAELRAIRNILPSFENGIEVGVGSGLFAAPLGIWKGVEPSEVMAEKARTRGIDVVPGTAEDLEFKTRSLDMVLMVTTICFVDDALKSLSEAYRVLKPGGSLILAFIDANSSLGQEYEKKKTSSLFYEQANFFSTDQLITLCRQAGFGDFAFVQTMLGGDTQDQDLQIKEGYGQGGFVVIRAQKPR